MRFLNINLLLVCIFFCLQINAQTININEAVSSNSSFFDEDRESPDWIELHNYGTEDINLEGYFITDKINNPSKWRFPNTNIKTDEYLVLWASKKDRTYTVSWRGMISQGDVFQYLVPQQNVDPEWTNLEFDDSSWESGASGFGYGDGDDSTTIPQGSTSIYIRRKFNVQDITAATAIYLDMDYDDGYVAYINGVEIARANIDGYPPNYDDTTDTDHEASIYNGGLPERIFMNNLGDYLQEGENVFCVQGHNTSLTSSDFSLIPFLTIAFTETNTSGSSPAEILNLGDEFLHTNFKISVEGESLHLFNSDTVLVSSLEVPALSSNIAFGLNEQTGETAYFEIPTPGEANTSPALMGLTEDDILFSHDGGQSEPLELTMTVDGNKDIRYTDDSTEPTEESELYVNPINIDQTTIIRARVYEDNYVPSRIQTRSYLVNINHNIPIISLVTEPDNFFSEESGIYVFGPPDYDMYEPYFGANFWEDWERPINFSFYDEETNEHVSIDGGVKIFGGWSRANAQRSLSIFARNQYGDKEIDYPIFSNLPYQKFQALILRNAGNDWLNANLRDGVMTTLMAGSGIEIQAYQPAATYFNGSYSGIYNVREKINEHFIASKFDIDPDSIKILELEGFEEEYDAFYNFIEANNLSLQANYDYVDSQMDIDNYIMYQIAQIFVNNTDWPGNNIRFWKSPETKWRWILFDTDFGFNIWNNFDHFNNTLAFALESNGDSWPNPSWSTLIFRKLMANNDFKVKFVNRYADELNTRFLVTNVRAHIDSIAAISNSEVQRHYDRWGGNVSSYSSALSYMRNYADNRPQQAKNHILSTLNLPNYHPLTTQIDDTTMGYIQLNSLRLDDQQWNGDYFENAPFNIEAIAREGFAFSHWSGSINSTDAVQEINIQGPMTLIANFSPIVSNDNIDLLNTFEIYPNPSSAELNITVADNEKQELAISILDQNGRLIKVLKRITVGNEKQRLSFSLDEMPEGIYFIQLKNDAGETVVKEWVKVK